MSVSLRRAAASVSGWQAWSLDEPLRSLLLAVIAIAATATAVAPAHTRWHASDAAIFAALLACGAITIESSRGVREVHGTVGRDLQTVWYLTMAITLPPVYAMLAPIPLGAYRLWRVRSGLMYRRVFSNATLSLAYGAASVIFRAFPRSVAGPRPEAGLHVLAWTGLVAGCGVVAWMINNGFLLGAIKLCDRQARVGDMFANREAFTSDLIELTLAVSLSLVVAINPVLMALSLPSIVLYRRYLMHSQLVTQARIDAKTGLLNAGTWQHEAEVEFARAQRTGMPLAVAMVDIDHFKTVNDTVGHLAGDRVLRGIAGSLRENLRSYDLTGRFGGDEFAILFPQTKLNEARRISERLRDKIAGDPVVIEDGTHAGYIFRLTVSIGVAASDGSQRSFDELIAIADAALETAKRAGRNRVATPADPGAAA
ncbi:MAG TPA: GGDEF domain-containing protein [Streptosporangiaceae bacterium]|jgi:diguanylate cyclase (GGDEF)-like protein